jgi:hypothetical protein
LLALLAAVTLVIVLSRQVAALRARETVLSQRATFLYPGYLLPAFAAHTLDGAELRIGRASAGGRQILAALNTTCPHCLASLPAWNQLADVGNQDGSFRVIGLSLDGGDSLVSYLKAHSVSFPVVVMADPALRFLYRTRSVPQTIIVDEAGRVMHLRRGRLEGQGAIDSVLVITRSRRGSRLPADSGTILVEGGL